MSEQGFNATPEQLTAWDKAAKKEFKRRARLEAADAAMAGFFIVHDGFVRDHNGLCHFCGVAPHHEDNCPYQAWEKLKDD